MNNYKVQQNEPIINVMRQINDNSLQIVLVVDQENHLCGTVTDGDTRRAVLKGIDLQNTPIEAIMNLHPHVASLGDSKDKIMAIMRSNKVRQVPIVDRDNHVVHLTTLDHLTNEPQYVNSVVIMAGGLGSRLGDLTQNCPKPLLTVGGKPVLETIIENFKMYGFVNFVLSVNYKAEMIEDYFKDGSSYNVNITYLKENKRLGTAGALGLIREKPEKPFFVINGDVLTRVNFEHLLQFHSNESAVATMGVREYSIQVPYGVVESNGTKMLGITEKPIHRHFVSTGIYMFNPEILDYVKKNEYLDMPVLFEKLLNRKEKVVVFPIGEYWMDIGQRADLEEAREKYKDIFGR